MTEAQHLKQHQDRPRITFLCKSIELTSCNYVKSALSAKISELKQNAEPNLDSVHFLWTPSFLNYFRGLKSKLLNDPYIKELTKFLHTDHNNPGNQDQDQVEIYRRNFETLDLENDLELKTAVELIEK